MHINHVEDVITKFLDGAGTIPERLERVQDILHLLKFEERWAKLEEHEREDVIKTKVFKLTPSMKETLQACKTDVERESKIQELARATYLRRAAWSDYLYGKCNNKPLIAPATA